LRYWTLFKGARVFDIGEKNKAIGIKSDFYKMEYNSIYKNWKYKNVTKLEGY
jgi:hypothetical protein